MLLAPGVRGVAKSEFELFIASCMRASWCGWLGTAKECSTPKNCAAHCFCALPMVFIKIKNTRGSVFVCCDKSVLVCCCYSANFPVDMPPSVAASVPGRKKHDGLRIAGPKWRAGLAGCGVRYVWKKE